MKLRYVISILILGLFGAFSSVCAGTAADAVSVSDPHVRAMPPGQPTSLAYMGLKNNSDQDHAVVATEGTVARAVELHTHTMKDGMMHMHRVEKIDLPAGNMVMLQPGGLHVMLMGLKRDLVPGDNVTITLVFEDGSKKRLDIPVRKIQMTMKKMDDKKPMDHMQH